MTKTVGEYGREKLMTSKKRDNVNQNKDILWSVGFAYLINNQETEGNLNIKYNDITNLHKVNSKIKEGMFLGVP